MYLNLNLFGKSKKIYSILLVIIFILLTKPVFAQLIEDGRQEKFLILKNGDVEYRSERVAMSVGIGNYAVLSPLDYSVNDAESFGELLKNKGFFDVIDITSDGSGTTPNKNNILSVLNEIKYKAEKGQIKTFVFYFSGHGSEISGKQYLAPIEGNPDIIETLICLDEVFAILSDISKKAKVMVFLDSCRIDDKQKNTKNYGYTTINSHGIAVSYASSQGKPSYEIDELKHGLYTHYLLKGLNGEGDSEPDEYINFNEITNYLEKEMLNNPYEHQIPYVSQIEKTGEFEITYNPITVEPPVNLTIEETTENYIKISWDKLDNVSGYQVWRAEVEDGVYSPISDILTKNSHIDINVKQGKTYYYKVKSLRYGKFSELSESYVFAKAMLSGDIFPPTLISVEKIRGRSIEIRWIGQESFCYEVYRSCEKQSGYELIYINDENTLYERTDNDELLYFYKDTKVKMGVDYYYRIKAKKGDKLSKLSEAYTHAKISDELPSRVSQETNALWPMFFSALTMGKDKIWVGLVMFSVLNLFPSGISLNINPSNNNYILLPFMNNLTWTVTLAWYRINRWVSISFLEVEMFISNSFKEMFLGVLFPSFRFSVINTFNKYDEVCHDLFISLKLKSGIIDKGNTNYVLGIKSGIGYILILKELEIIFEVLFNYDFYPPTNYYLTINISWGHLL